MTSFIPEEPPDADADADPDPALEIIDTDATELDQVPDDAPGADSARW